ncbi:hypothetical protein ACFQZC_01065 [Streptacidiphilus monticola]
MRFSLLGPVRAWQTGHELDLAPRQMRLLLVALMTGARGAGANHLAACQCSCHRFAGLVLLAV